MPFSNGQQVHQPLQPLQLRVVFIKVLVFAAVITRQYFKSHIPLNPLQLYQKCKHTHPVPPLWIVGNTLSRLTPPLLSLRTPLVLSPPLSHETLNPFST